MLPEVIGHSETLAQVPYPLPSALLLTGPEGVGKRLVAMHLAAQTGVRNLDFQNLGPLNRENARALVEHHSTYPLHGEVKCSVADLTRSSPEATNSILKLLEEPPDYSHLILHSDSHVLLTVRSRCFNLKFGTLKTEEVEEVLTRLGEAYPKEAAKHSHGRVSVGVDHTLNTGSREAVEAVLRAVLSRDGSLIEAALAKAVNGPSDGSGRSLEARRATVANLLAQSLRSSLTNPHNAFAKTPEALRVKALSTLEGSGRAALKIRAAVWTLASGIGV